MSMIRRIAILLSAIFSVLMIASISTPSIAAHDHVHQHHTSHIHAEQSLAEPGISTGQTAERSLLTKHRTQNHHVSQPCDMSWMGDHEHCDACFGSKAGIVASYRLRSEPIVPATLSKTSPAFYAALLPVPPPDLSVCKERIQTIGRHGVPDNDLIVTTGRFRI